MTLLSRESILKKADLSYENVDVPEWGGTVRVQELSGKQREEYELSMLVDGEYQSTDFKIKLLSRSLVDEGGDLLFNSDDIEKLSGKSSIVVNRLFDVANKLSHISVETLEEAEKNS
ncbi:hypothetical protein [Shewanella surugensis]|uniref:Phage tail protein n=1 Tax=Shewanella surugensis TaxID=212020 RepID=A0ABT0LG92_9GAMM|nr:hypothetical protein [Shewanella surugensis]MCL1126708.1 hypothetical protein [Shewanella surugensis]